MHNPAGRDDRVRIIAIIAMMNGEKRPASTQNIILLDLEPELVVWFSCIKGDFCIIRYYSCLNQVANFASPSEIWVEGL
jgi:hypothetical protein